MTFLTFMVYFRGGRLYLPCPLVQGDQGPMFTIFSWVGISGNVNNCGAWRWEHFACIISMTLSLVKDRFAS